jgi:hypothetical protein
MKKVVVIFLLCIYSLATMGFCLKQFYCCGKLKSVTFSLTHETKEKCDKGDLKSNCCESKFQFLKIKDHHISAEKVDFIAKYLVDFPSYIHSFQHLNILSEKKSVAYRGNAPPTHLVTPLYIYHSVFRI